MPKHLAPKRAARHRAPSRPVVPAQARRAAAVGLAGAGLVLGLGVGSASAVPGGQLPTVLTPRVITQQTGAACAPSTSSAARGLTPKARNVLNCVSTAFPQITTYLGVGTRSSNSASDHPSGRAVDVMIPNWNTAAGKAQGWAIANHVAANGKAWGVNYVIFDAQIYVVSTGCWKTYRHPSGARDANSLHLNHVHVSVTR